ncbi:hypothetical protein LVB87_04180 [Lysobacter sp. KIS68-7]|uniref:hypothetical protein n=1 Tax=Lysobacter sp. KIS68-7 TaxID=2904252 RepID=UPI001E5B19B7|nr:hypothetical protein [Lysobacter sp. KIS68-7]UHQ20367.1 hypothetical protein LVB87_04180 [Lysobacter sp. KIS68-7]
MKKATLVVASAMLAAVSFGASAAKPAMTHQEKQDFAAKAQKKATALRATQPRTEGQARATLKGVAGGGMAIRVPTELWTTLGVQHETNGAVRMTEADGTSAPSTEGLPNE